MFQPGSRYEKTGTYSVTGPAGEPVVAARLPLPLQREEITPLGYHRRLEGHRLDHIAGVRLKDPTGFWRLCDTSNGMVPDTVAVRDLIAVPQKDR